MASDPNCTSGATKCKALVKKEVNKDISDEDLELNQQLELYVERIQDPDTRLRTVSLQNMRQALRTSVSSMTVSKTFKFLRPHYGTLKTYYETTGDFDSKKCLADILSFLAFTLSAKGKLESLKYRLLGSVNDIDSWGHEYVMNLNDGISHLSTVEKDLEGIKEKIHLELDNYVSLVHEIVAFHMQHNAEPEAIDLLVEIEELDIIRKYTDQTNFRRTCLYLTTLARYLEESNILALDVAFALYIKFEEYSNALRIALSVERHEVFESCDDVLQKKQLCYILGRHGLNWMLEEKQAERVHDRFMLQDVLNNRELSKAYLALARDIGVIEPKSPEDIYKAHLVNAGVCAGASVVSARLLNVAATFVNAFVNAGFGQDKLITVPSDSSSGGSTENWLFKNKENEKTIAVASLGLILLWDVDSGFAQVEKYIHFNDKHVTAGALLGVGILNCNIKLDHDPAKELLMKYMNDDDPLIKISAVMGLGITYAGTQIETLRDEIGSILYDNQAPLDVIAFAAISLGLIYVGSCEEEAVDAIISALMNRSESDWRYPFMRLLPLGLGLLYLGKEERMEDIEVPSEFNRKIRKYIKATLLSCAYAGTGDILVVKRFLGYCSEYLDDGQVLPGPAVLGIAMVGMAEELDFEMATRSLEHILHCGEQNIRRAAPLALGLLCISNPKINVADILSGLSHDTDSEVAMAAVISLGLIGAGTNNARIADLLCNLSSYYYQDPRLIFCVRIAQGLVHLGKGLLTLNPYHSDHFLLQPTALAGLITMLHLCLDMNFVVLGDYQYVLYFLVLAMQPRMLMTVDRNSKPLSVPVRVGRAVDVIGKAGHPKTITGFNTQSTPVLLGPGERAEMATKKYIALSPILEGFVILKENPDYREAGGP